MVYILSICLRACLGGLATHPAASSSSYFSTVSPQAVDGGLLLHWGSCAVFLWGVRKRAVLETRKVAVYKFLPQILLLGCGTGAHAVSLDLFYYCEEKEKKSSQFLLCFYRAFGNRIKDVYSKVIKAFLRYLELGRSAGASTVGFTYGCIAIARVQLPPEFYCLQVIRFLAKRSVAKRVTRCKVGHFKVAVSIL